MPQISILFILYAHNSSPGIKRVLVQLIHFNSPLAAEQSSPWFLHVHIRVSQSVSIGTWRLSRDHLEQVVNMLFVVQVDTYLEPSPFFWVQFVRLPHPLMNLEIHACTVVDGSSGCWRETVQLHISGTSSHLFGEMYIKQCIQYLAGTTSTQAEDQLAS